MTLRAGQTTLEPGFEAGGRDIDGLVFQSVTGARTQGLGDSCSDDLALGLHHVRQIDLDVVHATVSGPSETATGETRTDLDDAVWSCLVEGQLDAAVPQF